MESQLATLKQLLFAGDLYQPDEARAVKNAFSDTFSWICGGLESVKKYLTLVFLCKERCWRNKAKVKS